MPPTRIFPLAIERSPVDVIDQLNAWISQPSNSIFLWVVIGIVAVIVLFGLIAKFSRLSYHRDFSTDTEEANAIALGFQQLTQSANYWNDPTASLNGAREIASIQEKWGMYRAADLHDSIERLVTERRRREPWQRLLALRAEAARENGGAAPSARQWTAVVRREGGTVTGEEAEFISAVHAYEKIVDKRVSGATGPILSLDGYALGQAAALPAWAVSMELISEAEARVLIARVNEIARPEFASWTEFGRSYALGRAMHWSDGRRSEEIAGQAEESATAMATALDGKRRGPWGLLPWARTSR